MNAKIITLRVVFMFVTSACLGTAIFPPLTGIAAQAVPFGLAAACYALACATFPDER